MIQLKSNRFFEIHSYVNCTQVPKLNRIYVLKCGLDWLNQMLSSLFVKGIQKHYFNCFIATTFRQSFSAVWVIFCEKLLWKQSALCTAVKAKYYLQIVPNVLQTNFFMNRNCQTCQLLYSITTFSPYFVCQYVFHHLQIGRSVCWKKKTKN